MPAIGITGGAATGKSSFVRALLKHCPADLFDADACVHTLFATDAGLRIAIRDEFGPEAISPDETIDRTWLREIVFGDDARRRRLEALVHPRVRAVWEPIATGFKGMNRIGFFDIPLLFETRIEPHFDRVVVVASSPTVQRQRLGTNRGLAPDLIERMLAAQIDLPAKVVAADQVVWNDGSPAALDAQARLFAAYLRELYG